MVSFVPAIAELFMNEGNDEFRKKEYTEASRLYSEGIKVRCRDDELKAKLYSNRAAAHFKLGETFEVNKS